MILAKDHSVKTMVQVKNMVWPDGVSCNHVDGVMYISAAQVNRGALLIMTKINPQNLSIFSGLNLL